MGGDFTTAQLVALLNALRWCLIVSSALGCLLCVDGVRTAYKDVKWARVGNGGKKIASLMRLRVEVLLMTVFLLHLVLAWRYTVPIDTIVASADLLVPVAKARFVFNLSVVLLLCVKAVMRIGRRDLDQYYDVLAASAVLSEAGLFSHKRDSDQAQ